MFTYCLVCHTPFPTNEELEHFPTSTRVAYDPERGRRAVCRSCRRWSLAPIEDRWEALEELEKVVTDRSRLLSQTDNVALLRAGHLDVVRVGRANLTEEAWWRYGRELTERATNHKKLMFMGTAAAGGQREASDGWVPGFSGKTRPTRWPKPLAGCVSAAVPGGAAIPAPSADTSSGPWPIETEGI